MTTTLNGEQAASRMGITQRALIGWRQNGFFPAIERNQYSACYVHNLVNNRGGPPIRQWFALLYYLCEFHNRTPVTASHPFYDRCITLIQQGHHVVTVRAAAELLDCGISHISSWSKQGRLRSFLVYGRRYLIADQIVELRKTLIEGLSIPEAADILGLSAAAVASRRKAGVLSDLPTPGRIVRLDPDEVERYRQELAAQVPASPIITVAETARRLNVSIETIRNWHNIDIADLGLTVIKGVGYCRESDVAAMEQAFRQLQPEFSWLQALLSATGRPVQTYNRGKTARYLSVNPEGALKDWSNDSLLPFFNQTPPNSARRTSEYPSLYLFGLRRWLAGRPARRELVTEYRSLCTATGQVI